jgi:hypothetical protein
MLPSGLALDPATNIGRALLSLEYSIDKDHVFGGIPIVRVARGELVMPFPPAVVRIERNDRAREQIIPEPDAVTSNAFPDNFPST